MASIAADRTLQYGLLALRTGLIDEDQLRSALGRWARDKVRPLAEHFNELGAPRSRSSRAARRPLVATPQEARRRHREEPGGPPGRAIDP